MTPHESSKIQVGNIRSDIILHSKISTNISVMVYYKLWEQLLRKVLKKTEVFFTMKSVPCFFASLAIR